MIYAYQEQPRYRALFPDGLEELVEEELAGLGATNFSRGFRAVYFDADPAALYRVTYASRLVVRILAPLVSFSCHSPDYLYQRAKQVPWEQFLGPDDTFAIQETVANSRIRHSQYAARRVKDAIADRFREQAGRRPNVERKDPTLLVNLYLESNQATLSVDISGGSLHRRGYRRRGTTAPLQEVLAAAIIRWAEWSGERPLYDPMCGSGTLLAEGLIRAGDLPAGFKRLRFGFQRLPDFQEKTWRRVKAEQDKKVKPLPAGLVSGGDRDPAAVAVARENLKALPGGEKVGLRAADFRETTPPAGAVIVCNPPYGVRQGAGEDLATFYRELGDWLKQKATGATAFLFCGNRELIKRIGLRPAWKKPLRNAGLDGRLVKYEMY